MTNEKDAAVKRAREDYLAKELATLSDYKNTFGSKQGQRVLADLMRNNFMYETTFASTPHEMALREGGRNLLMQIINKLETHPDQLRDLIRESINVGSSS